MIAAADLRDCVVPRPEPSASLLALVNGLFASIDTLNGQAVSLGINTKSLSQLTHAANLAGGS